MARRSLCFLSATGVPALAMVVFFGWILPLGNRAVAWLDE